MHYTWIAFVLGVSSLAACSEASSNPRATAVAPIALRYQVGGMHCDGCVQAITDKVKHVDGVVDCRVSLATKQADVVVRDNAVAPAVQRVIEKLGYTATPLPNTDAH